MTDISTVLLSNTAIPSCGTTRWMSPELLDPVGFDSDGLPSCKSDCYALGMTIYEVVVFSLPGVLWLIFLQVLSGLPPFHHLRSPVVSPAILRGERPGRPLDALTLGFTDTLWELLQLCWSESASARPTARQLFDYLHPASLTWKPPTLCPTAGGNVVSSPSSEVFRGSGASLSSRLCRIQ